MGLMPIRVATKPPLAYHDVSHFQANYQPTGPTCAKATEGSDYTDPVYTDIRTRTLAGGWPFLPYHYLRVESTVSDQAAHLVSVAGATSIMLDVEANSGTLSNVLNFMDAYASVGGKVTLVYLPRWYWQQIGSPDLTPITQRGAGLVSSNYPTGGYTANGPGWLPYGGVTPIIWQYTSTPLDTNAYKGTQAQLASLWANGLEAPDVELTDKLSNGKTVDAALVAASSALNSAQKLGSSGPTVGVALQTGSNTTVNNGKTLASLAAAVAALQAAVAAIPTTAAPAAPLSDADVDRIANRVLDLQAQRLES